MTAEGDSSTPQLQLDIDPLVRDGARARTIAALFGEQNVGPVEIGGCEVLGVIGRGGMGVVYRAYDARLGRTIAIKRLLPSRTSGPQRRQLLEEARQLARVQHEHVVEVFEVGEHDGSPYLAMEYVEGPSLQQWLRSADREPDEICTLLLQAGRGLAAAHARDVVHLDFKPANVLVAPGPNAKVADFGLAQLFAPGTLDANVGIPAALTLSGAAGTPAYMAPEQCRGQVSAKTDQFAFAVSMLEALGGRRPFGASIPALLDRDEYARQLRAFRCEGTPHRMLTALRRACAYDPEQRWPSLRALLEVLAPPTRREWGTAAVFASSVVVAGLGAWVAVGSSEPSPCTPLSEGIVQAWGATTRDEVNAALGLVETSGATSGQRFILERLDGVAHSWAEQRLALCEAARSDTGPEDPLLDQRFSCLQSSQTALASAVTFAHDEPQRVITQPQALVASLPDVSACSEDERLRADEPPVPTALKAEVESVQRTLVRVEILHRLGDLTSAKEMLEDAEAQSKTIAHAPLHARLDSLHGSLALTGLDHAGARVRLEAAFDSANALGMVDLACSVALDLAFLLATEAGAEDDDPQRWLRHAEALNERGGDHLRLPLALASAAVARSRGDLEGALASLTEAVEESSRSATPLEQAKHLANRSVVLVQLGRFEEAEHGVRDAWRLNRTNLSDAHPLALLSEVRLANVLRIQGKAAESLPHAQHAYAGLRGRGSDGELEASSALGNSLSALSDPRACAQLEESVALATALFHAEHPIVAPHKLNLAGCVAASGDASKAVQLLQDVVDLFERVQSPNLSIAQHALSDTLLRLAVERPEPEATQLRERAERVSRISADATASARGPDTPLQAGALEVRGRALLQLGRPAEAEPVFTRVVSLRQSHRTDLLPRAELLLQIARRETGAQNVERLQTARDAVAATEADLTTAWLEAWLITHGLDPIDAKD